MTFTAPTKCGDGPSTVRGTLGYCYVHNYHCKAKQNISNSDNSIRSIRSSMLLIFNSNDWCWYFSETAIVCTAWCLYYVSVGHVGWYRVIPLVWCWVRIHTRPYNVGLRRFGFASAINEAAGSAVYATFVWPYVIWPWHLICLANDCDRLPSFVSKLKFHIFSFCKWLQTVWTLVIVGFLHFATLGKLGFDLGGIYLPR